MRKLLLAFLLVALVAQSLGAKEEPKPKEAKKEEKKVSKKLEKALKEDKKQEIQTFEEVDGKLKKVSNDIISSNLTDANRMANEALRVLKSRAAKLVERKGECSRLETVGERRICFGSVQEQVRKIRQEKAMVGDLRDCNAKYGSQMNILVKCVRNVKLRHSLLSPDGAPKPQDKALDSNRKVKALVTAVSSNDSLAEHEVTEAVAHIREKLESLASQYSMCRSLKTLEARVGCRQGLKKLKEENLKERQLLARLDRCGEIFAFDDKSRERCSKLVGKKILALVNHKGTTTTKVLLKETKRPMVEDKAPANIPALKRDEKRAYKVINDRISAMHSAIRQCKDTPCKEELHKKLQKAKNERDAIKDRFAYRLKCLKQRAAFQKKEFEVRAREHTRMMQLHAKAAKCETKKCLRRLEKLERAMDKLLGKRRAARHAEWKKIRCFYVLPYSAVAPENKTYKTLAGLHFKVHLLYKQINQCKTDDCRDDLKFSLSLYKSQIKSLQRYLGEKSFTNRIRRHKNRFRLHRAYSMLYRRALDCPSRECQLKAKHQIASLQKVLEAEARDFVTGDKDDALDFHVGDDSDDAEDDEE